MLNEKSNQINLTYSSAIVDAKNYTNWILSQFEPYIYGKVLEIGIGHGSYFKYLNNYEKYLGVDINEISVKNASKLYPEINFCCADITTPSFKETAFNYSPDSILCFNVLEHVEKDFLAISNLSECLQRGGNLLIFVPALKLLYNDLDCLAGHYRRYNKSMIYSLISTLPLKVVSLYYFNPIGGFVWLLNRLTSHKSLDSRVVNQQIILFDKYVLPVSKMLNPLTHNFFGQSLIVILEKI